MPQIQIVLSTEVMDALRDLANAYGRSPKEQAQVLIAQGCHVWDPEERYARNREWTAAYNAKHESEEEIDEVVAG